MQDFLLRIQHKRPYRIKLGLLKSLSVLICMGMSKLLANERFPSSPRAYLRAQKTCGEEEIVSLALTVGVPSSRALGRNDPNTCGCATGISLGVDPKVHNCSTKY